MLYFFDQLLESKQSEKLYEFRNRFTIKYSKEVEKYKNIAKKECMQFYNFITRNKGLLSLDFSRYLRLFLENERNIIEVLENVRRNEEIIEYDMFYELSTAHAYKGKEASWVEIMPDKWSLSSSEEANICYVACSRSINRLDASHILELLEEKNNLHFK